MMTLDQYIRNLEDIIAFHEELCWEKEISHPVRKALRKRIEEKTQLLEWLTDYKKLKGQQEDAS